MRLILLDLFGGKPANALKAVGFSSPVKFLKPRELARIRCNDNLAAAFVRDPMLGAEAVHRFSALNAVPRFHRARLVVKTGVDDAAVVSCLVNSEAVFRLKKNHS